MPCFKPSPPESTTTRGTMYFQVFNEIMVAGAFKGAGGQDMVFPDEKRYLETQQSYMRLLDQHPKD